jgi:hypothetical protein
VKNTAFYKQHGQARCFRLHITHNLLQFSDNVESIANQTTLVLAFGLSAGDKSFRVFYPVRIENSDFAYGEELTTTHFMYLYVGTLEEIHYHIPSEGFQ